MKNYILVGSDLHCPYIDKDSWLEFLKASKHADEVYLIGDVIDFYSLSRFDKSPDRILSLQDDINFTKDILKQLRITATRANIHLLGGNHEARLQKWLSKHPEISCLECLTVQHLLDLTELQIAYWEPESIIRLNDKLILEHGQWVSMHSALSAKMQLERRGISGISGHTHRLGSYFKTDLTGTKAWYEIGCLCSFEQEYCLNPNWMHGYCIIEDTETPRLITL